MLRSAGIVLKNQEKREHTPAVVLIMATAAMPLFFRLPIWIALWCLLLWGYTALAHYKHWPWPNRVVRTGLTVTGCVLALHFLERSFVGGRTFLGLLCIMAGLKPLENACHRDRMMTLLLVYFTFISSLFVIENLLITLYMFFAVFITTAGLIHFNHSRMPAAHGLRLSAIILAQAIPFMIILFVFFPRSEGTFFSASRSGQGSTGFSDSLAPGSVSTLVKSNSIAFRAEFKGDIPAAENLYWRGLVLWDFDGRTWRKGRHYLNTLYRFSGRNRVDYDIFLEPHRKRYLLAIGLEQALAIPETGNPQSRALAAHWRAQFDSEESIIKQAIAYFQANPFQYTLNPPLLSSNPVDAFLFETRKGYCEHYASAFAFLMRAAGIPARIVVGYLGGERNPYGNYLIVRQYQAHAWTEVFVAAKGWVRVDPTSAVAPERVSTGVAESLIADELPQFLQRGKFAGLRLYWEKTKYFWDSINLRWNAWFMEFSRYEQLGLRMRLGRIARSHLNQIVFAGAALIAVAASLVLFRSRRGRAILRQDPVVAGYYLLCKKMERAGVKREAFQGPRDFVFRKVKRFKPAKARPGD
ncbi:MAG: transglutaminaseTgpA domain-containing protein [Deltaproteobacteria bacterium]